MPVNNNNNNNNNISINTSQVSSVNETPNHVSHVNYVTEPVNSNESIKNNLLLTTAVDKLQDYMTSSMTEQILSINSDPLPPNLVTSELEALNNNNSNNILNSKESVLNINENI